MADRDEWWKRIRGIRAVAKSCRWWSNMKVSDSHDFYERSVVSWTHTHTHTHIYIYIYIYIYVCVCVCVCVFGHVYACIWWKVVFFLACIFVSLYACVCVCVYVSTCVRISLYLNVISCRLLDLSRAMADRDGWRKRVKGIRVVDMSWWWW